MGFVETKFAACTGGGSVSLVKSTSDFLWVFSLGVGVFSCMVKSEISFDVVALSGDRPFGGAKNDSSRDCLIGDFIIFPGDDKDDTRREAFRLFAFFSGVDCGVADRPLRLFDGRAASEVSYDGFDGKYVPDTVGSCMAESFCDCDGD